MLEFKSKILTVLVNVLLIPWLILQWVPSLIVLAIFHNASIYHNKDADIFVIKVNKGMLFGNACFSCGPVIFVTPHCDENTIRHETGHSKQSLMFGPLFQILVSLPSVIRFWIRRFCNKSHEWYLNGWPEGGCKFGAEELGHTHRD
jgi:hypothetical protein